MSSVVRLCLVQFALSGTAAEPSSAQRAYPCPDSLPTGIEVRGTVRSAETKEPVHRAVVVDIGAGFCTAVTDDLGRFWISNIPPGNHLITVASLGFRRFAPRPISVTSDTTVMVNIILEAENLAADCFALDPCAPFLSGPPLDPEMVTPQQALREAASRLAIGLAGGDWESTDWYACLAEDPVVTNLLRLSFANLANPVDCAFQPPADPRSRTFRHTPSGLPARRIEVSVLESDGIRARIEASYLAGRLHALGWECSYEGGPYSWMPTVCTMTWIS